MLNKIILFDIDYTLFNTDKYRDITHPQLMKLLQQEDTPFYHEKVKEVESELIERGYEPVAFAKTLSDALSIQPEKEAIINLFYDKNLYKSCLYSEAERVLNVLSQMKSIKLGINSKGEKTFQERKIEHIRHFFSESLIYISLNKLFEFKRFYKKYEKNETFAVDDSALYLHEVKEERPSVFTVLVEKENRYEKKMKPKDFYPDYIISNLEELLSILL